MEAQDHTTFHEDAAIAKLTEARQRRGNPTIIEPLPHETIRQLGDRVDRAEATVKNLRSLVLGALALCVLAIVGLIVVLVMEQNDPTVDDIRQLLDESLRQPIERLERAVERLEQRTAP